MILGTLAILLALAGNWTAAWWVFGIAVFFRVFAIGLTAAND